ncbi:hypothetical protein PISL3812_09818 [Talaromyces islandicus]|uniref:Uncharacterized protein n=1 Tax=Talaromyces islandicus TaxID=28573 RepID=A0A0U1MCB6_TALIS|nr:hypothetical protein PISL3812_09818 [Talaromyces islandicus]
MGFPENIEANISQPAPRGPRSALLLILFIATIISMGCTFLLYNAEASCLALLVNPFLWPVIPMPFRAFSTNNVTFFDKPKDIKIFAVVGYRNPARTAILNCYLQKNLVENGGLIDEVIFIAETTETGHLEWLNGLTNSSDLYSISTAEDMSYSSRDLYLQIDGDVVYIEGTTIPTMINTKMQHPESLIVSANVIHQSAVAKFHQRSGVILPYIPELSLGQRQLLSSSSDNSTSSSNNNGHGFLRSILPYRMLEFFETNSNNNKLPTGESNWMVQAQQHYSFLYHLAQGSLGVYKFPSWKNPPSDVSRAFTCIRGGDMDVISERSETSWLRKRTIIDGKGVVSHYSSSISEEAGLGLLDSTDVVQRYQSFAEENVCPGVKSLI